MTYTYNIQLLKNNNSNSGIFLSLKEYATIWINLKGFGLGKKKKTQTLSLSLTPTHHEAHAAADPHRRSMLLSHAADKPSDPCRRTFVSLIWQVCSSSSLFFLFDFFLSHDMQYRSGSFLFMFLFVSFFSLCAHFMCLFLIGLWT